MNFNDLSTNLQTLLLSYLKKDEVVPIIIGKNLKLNKTRKKLKM